MTRCDAPVKNDFECITLDSDDENEDPIPVAPIKKVVVPPPVKKSAPPVLIVKKAIIDTPIHNFGYYPDYPSSEDEDEIPRVNRKRKHQLMNDLPMDHQWVWSSQLEIAHEEEVDFDGKPVPSIRAVTVSRSVTEKIADTETMKNENNKKIVLSLCRGIDSLRFDRRLAAVHGSKMEQFLKKAGNMVDEKKCMILKPKKLRDIFALQFLAIAHERQTDGEEITLSKVYRAIKRAVKSMGPGLDKPLLEVLDMHLGYAKFGRSKWISITILGRILEKLIDELVFYGFYE